MNLQQSILYFLLTTEHNTVYYTYFTIQYITHTFFLSLITLYKILFY